MTKKEFTSIRPGDKVMFVKSGDKLNGKVVTISRIRGDEIIAPNPEFDNKLCSWKYTHFIPAAKESQQPSGAVLCRVMTEKSIMGFGKYADMRVGDVLKVDPQYIVVCYARRERISFTDDILSRLGVRKIRKPGTDDGVFKEWLKSRLDGLSTDERNKVFLLHNVGRKRAMKAALVRAIKATSYTKAELQAINHGHAYGKD